MIVIQGFFYLLYEYVLCRLSFYDLIFFKINYNTTSFVVVRQYFCFSKISCRIYKIII